MSNWKPFHEFLAENMKIPCDVAGCTELREGQGRYCKRHKSVNTVWGHPAARSILPREFKQEEADINRLLSRNSEHAGVAWGVDFLNNSMKAAANGIDVSGQGMGKWFANLHRNRDRFKTVDLLARLAAVTLLYERDELHRVLKNHRHYVTVLGRHTTTFARTRGGLHFTPKSYRVVGPFILKNLGVLLLNMARSTEAMLAYEQKVKQVAHTEFNL